MTPWDRDARGLRSVPTERWFLALRCGARSRDLSVLSADPPCVEAVSGALAQRCVGALAFAVPQRFGLGLLGRRCTISWPVAHSGEHMSIQICRHKRPVDHHSNNRMKAMVSKTIEISNAIGGFGNGAVVAGGIVRNGRSGIGDGIASI